MIGRQKLVIAANRLPVNRVTSGGSVSWTRSPGGLVGALEPVFAERGGVWIGWDGGTGRVARPRNIEGITMSFIPMSRGDVAGFYQGFSNSTLWPLYHDAISPPQFHRSWWGDYIQVNERFAKAVSRHAAKRALVWIHDYHLQLVPGMLRKLRPDLRIGFFLHIPFPPEELFAWLPWRSAILRGLLGADLVSFQTDANAQNFSRASRRDEQAEGSDRELDVRGRKVLVRSNPISIDAEHFERLANKPSVKRKAIEIKRELGGRKILLGVDRLDYTKGIPNRLTAFEELLESKRLTVDNTVLVQIAVPSRETAPGYAEVRSEIEQTVGRINGEHSRPGRIPVHYFRRSLSHEELASYYLAADVMLVTPLRDGMNLVAKEFVACRGDFDGVLVLSEFAGAARELRRALLVNPRDIETLKNVIVTALRMPKDEKRMRMAILRTQVRRHNVFHWASSFLETLE